VRPPVATVAVVGAGVIGRSWAALMLARGLDVRVMDPRPEVGDALRTFVDDAWPALRSLGLAHGEPPSHLAFTTDLAAACSGAGFVQESGPERLEVKHELYRQIEAAADPAAVIASSTSSLRATDLQRGADHPERILVCHPMNPPHLIPLVEIVAGERTSAAVVERARAFYASLRREVVIARREAVGHIANRLTSALYREAVNIVAEGIASVADVDRAIASGPGLRWALMGPHLIYHLAGGDGGYRGYLDHLGPSQEARWRTLGDPRLTPEVKEALVAGLVQALAGAAANDLAERRDRALLEILAVKKRLGF